MTQDQPADDRPVLPAAEEAAAADQVSASAVAFVLPATAYESVVTMPDATPTAVATTGPTTADEPGHGTSEAVAALAERLDRRFDELRAILQRETRAEAAREKVIDRLHAELQEYKQDLLLSTLRPVFVDLIQLHDDIGKVALAPPEAEGGGDGLADLRRLVGLMEGFQQGIEDILYRQGVEPFRVDGDTFDPRRQRAVGTVATADPALNKTVAARIRKGFRAGERVIRPELVSVFAHKT